MKTSKNNSQDIRSTGRYFIYALLMLFASPVISVAQNNNKPKISINVHKKTDKNGNIISYDSTYSYSWSGGDSVPQSFDQGFKNNDMGNFNQLFKEQDSILSKMAGANWGDFGNMFSFGPGNMPSAEQMQKMMQKAMSDFGKNTGFDFMAPGYMIPPVTPVTPQKKAPAKKKNKTSSSKRDTSSTPSSPPSNGKTYFD